jgi:hypothetical protein
MTLTDLKQCHVKISIGKFRFRQWLNMKKLTAKDNVYIL